MSPCKHLYLEWACLSELVYPCVVYFYCAMLFIRGTSQGPVSVSVCLCLSQVEVLLKRLYVGSHKEHRTIAQRL